MPPEKYEKVFTISFGNRVVEYQKGAPGSFDASYFTDPLNGKFRFPDYNQPIQGLVRIKDITNYNKAYFYGMNGKQKAAFTLDDFERRFRTPTFVIEKFHNFMKRFPEASFNKGMTREEVFDLFYEMRYYTTDQPELMQDVYYWPAEDIGAAIDLGLLSPVDTTTDPARHWSAFTLNDLKDLCTEYGVKPGSSKQVCVNRLMEANTTFPYIAFVPTPLLKETYWSFIDLYLDDIREQAKRFHPLYLETFWRAVQKQAEERGVWRRVQEILSAPYWSKLLVPATKTYNYDDDDE